MNDELWKQIAKEYIQDYGKKLICEDSQLKASPQHTVTPSLDRKVFTHIKRAKRSRNARTITLTAACIVFMLVTPLLLRILRDDTGFEKPPASAAEISDSEGVVPDSEPIPISFIMPERFSVEDCKLDNGKTVYHLADKDLDDIIMTMEYNGEVTRDDSLKNFTINGYPAYGKLESGYRLLAFEKDDITYTMTCRYDFDTLLALSQHVLI